jgi:hypothetical protein
MVVTEHQPALLSQNHPLPREWPLRFFAKGWECRKSWVEPAIIPASIRQALTRIASNSNDSD